MLVLWYACSLPLYELTGNISSAMTSHINPILLILFFIGELN
jgi:hypothetical protein